MEITSLIQTYKENGIFFTKEQKNRYIQKLKQIIELEENKFRDSYLVRPDVYSHGQIKRKIITDYGAIWVYVYRYYKWVAKIDNYGEVNGRKKDVFYSDFFTNLVSKGKNIVNNLKEKVVQLSLEVKQTESIARLLGKVISASSINLILRELEINSNLTVQDFSSLAKDQDTIYMAVDDAFNKVRYGTKTPISTCTRMMVLYLLDDKKKIVGKTNILEIKKIREIKNKPTVLAQIVLKTIQNVYKKKLKIVIFGDGAKWIKNLAKSLNAKYILDKYHLVKKASDLVSFKNNNSLNKKLFSINNQPKIYWILKDLLEKQSLFEVIFFMQSIQKNLKEFWKNNLYDSTRILKKINEIGKFIHYVKFNYEAIQNVYSNLNTGSNTESLMAHLIKKNTKFKRVIFSEKRFKNNLVIHHFVQDVNLFLI
ncbi:Mbov_0401 family ICE element transposase-like protein [Mesomycoplasma conjunctivae]|uniref:Mbov_0401 family ICE element transposase-like protein n=1 Tax=Mesomycoplasma conjunctivae TaxID=45361 RepID=UPI003DA4B263